MVGAKPKDVGILKYGCNISNKGQKMKDTVGISGLCFDSGDISVIRHRLSGLRYYISHTGDFFNEKLERLNGWF